MDNHAQTPQSAAAPNSASQTTYAAGVTQARAFRVLTRQTAAYLKPYDLSCMQWFVIGTIYDAGDAGIKLSDLCTQLDTTLPFITTSIKVLESRGIVVKHPHPEDNRTKLVSITHDYAATVPRIEADLRTKLRGLLYGNDTISHDELGVYLRVLAKISS